MGCGENVGTEENIVHGSESDYSIICNYEFFGVNNTDLIVEPFGGAATCLGGAIRDPLSGRGYVYQAMRVTGAADLPYTWRSSLPPSDSMSR